MLWRAHFLMNTLCYGIHIFFMQQSEDSQYTEDIRIPDMPICCIRCALFEEELPDVPASNRMQTGPVHHAHSEVARNQIKLYS